MIFFNIIAIEGKNKKVRENMSQICGQNKLKELYNPIINLTFSDYIMATVGLAVSASFSVIIIMLLSKCWTIPQGPFSSAH